MTAVRDRWTEVEPPAAVADAHELFLDALDRYVAAAERLASATTDDDRRASLVDEAIALGTEGDELYDQAAALVQGLLVASRRGPGRVAAPALTDLRCLPGPGPGQHRGRTIAPRLPVGEMQTALVGKVGGKSVGTV